MRWNLKVLSWIVLTRLIKSSLLALWHFMQDVSAVWRGLVIQWEVNFLTPSRI